MSQVFNQQLMHACKLLLTSVDPFQLYIPKHATKPPTCAGKSHWLQHDRMGERNIFDRIHVAGLQSTAHSCKQIAFDLS